MSLPAFLSSPFPLVLPVSVSLILCCAFGREVVDTGAPSGISVVGNIIWFLVAGLWLAISHIATAAIQAVTIIGIPMAWANLKLIPVTCFPFGKKIVNSRDKQAYLFPVAR